MVLLPVFPPASLPPSPPTHTYLDKLIVPVVDRARLMAAGGAHPNSRPTPAHTYLDKFVVPVVDRARLMAAGGHHGVHERLKAGSRGTLAVVGGAGGL